jgi:hypothetical protein
MKLSGTLMQILKRGTQRRKREGKLPMKIIIEVKKIIADKLKWNV